MSATPRFFNQPLRYLRWASHEKPALFYSTVLGAMGPLAIIIAPPIRRFLGDDYEVERIPMTYPVPNKPRVIPEGYDD